MAELKTFPKNKPLFGEHELFPRNPFRDWIREYIPAPKDGYVAEDLDLIFLRFGEIIERDKNADGQFILCEWKFRAKELPYSQKRVFGLIDRLLRLADPTGEFYQGFYYIRWDGDSDTLCLNGLNITQQQFQMFLMGGFPVPPLSFEN